MASLAAVLDRDRVDVFPICGVDVRVRLDPAWLACMAVELDAPLPRMCADRLLCHLHLLPHEVLHAALDGQVGPLEHHI